MMTHQSPVKAFYRVGGSRARGEASAETVRMEPREWTEGRAFQWGAVSSVCSVSRDMRADVTNRKMVLVFLFV